MKTSDGYMNRLILIVGICFGTRLSVLHELPLDQVKQSKLCDKDVIVFQAKVGSRNGASKLERIGRYMLGKRPKKVVVWDISVLDGTLNIYQDVRGCLCLRPMMQMGINRLLLRVRPNSSDPVTFFVGQAMGKNAFNPRIKKMCNGLGVFGNGFYDSITFHSFRATMIHWLLDAKHPETVIAKRSGHKDMRSMKASNNLRGT